MHSIISEIAQDKWESVKKDDIDIVIAEDLGLCQSFFQFLLDKYIDLV